MTTTRAIVLLPLLLLVAASSCGHAQAKIAPIGQAQAQAQAQGEAPQPQQAQACEPRGGLRVPDLAADHVYDLITLIEITRRDSPLGAVRPSQFASMQIFEDRNDCAIIAKTNDPRKPTCIAVFKATDFENPFDIAQLWDWGTSQVESCTFRSGMVSAYYSDYHDDFVAALDRCMATTKFQPTPKLLLGGHSQGGAISVVASVDLKRYNPTVVALGAVRSLVEPCPTATTSTNHYRFVNCINGNYDFWSTVFDDGDNGIHIGQPIFLDPTAKPGYMASTTYLNDNTNMEPTDTFNHDPDIYWLSISQWLQYERAHPCNLEDLEYIVEGWEDGHTCNLTSECIGGHCINHSCQSS